MALTINNKSYDIDKPSEKGRIGTARVGYLNAFKPQLAATDAGITQSIGKSRQAAAPSVQ